MIYLKVKLRKERSLARSEYLDVRDRIEDLRARAARRDVECVGGAGARARPARAAIATTAPGPQPRHVGSRNPDGTEIDVRLSNTLNSGTAKVEDRFEATTLVDVTWTGARRCRPGR